MTEDEMNKVASLVSAHLKSESVDDLVGPEENVQCFTCSGRFRCRPSFLIQSPGTTLTSQTAD